ncbi:MAG TPA: TraR/DksA family transcriptional regulator [Saprospiraceae bacterium]|nr:TraR/DksA family transcriptional regulator [Saprospiraceae bacterium]
MDIQTKKRLKQKIIQEMKSTNRDILQLEEQTKPISPDDSIGRITRMDAINNKSVAESSLRMLRKKLTNLQLALSKIDEENFGQCISCGKSINEKRLMFMPESRYCILCAQ